MTTRDDATLDEARLRSWIGNSDRDSDCIAPRQARLMRATLGGDQRLEEGDPLPPLWHWLYFADSTARDRLAADGHAKLGGFLPPVALARRMWAGGRLEFHAPLRLGDRVIRLSTIEDVRIKRGRTGTLCFITVRRELSVDGNARLTEHHDIVYRETPAAGLHGRKPTASPPGHPVWSRTVVPDPVLLFRYSALSFNAHRIHYDRDYCRDVEGYPGLVFHGPLAATLLLELAVAGTPGRVLAGYTFQAVAPLFDTAPFVLAGRPGADSAELWAETPEGALAMTASARFA